MPTWKPSLIQLQLGHLIFTRFPDFLAGAELTVRLREGRFLIPDVAVVHKDHIQDPYPTEPIHFCIGILSPDDRFSQVLAKAEEYHQWGVPMVWIIDPDNRIAWEFGPGRGPHEVPAGGALTASPISIPLDDLFAAPLASEPSAFWCYETEPPPTR